VKFFVDYANVASFQPRPGGAESSQALDRWLYARTDQLVADMQDAYDRFWTPDATRSFMAFVDDVSNWYIRRSRRRFWDGDSEALQALWHALSRGVQVISPVMPFLADHLWRTLRSDEQPDSVFLEPWPEHGALDEHLLAEVAEVRAIVELGRQARGEAGLKFRQPLRRMVVQGAEKAKGHADEIGEELRSRRPSCASSPTCRSWGRGSGRSWAPSARHCRPASSSSSKAGGSESTVMSSAPTRSSSSAVRVTVGRWQKTIH
jgi:isoleucyl-tRNA synthetase